VDTNFFGELDKVPNLVFSQPMSSADEVADAVLECLARPTTEIAMPALSGKLATMAYLFPALARTIRPWLEELGAANKRRYAQRKGLPQG
jgi:hypothetical protein